MPLLRYSWPCLLSLTLAACVTEPEKFGPVLPPPLVKAAPDKESLVEEIGTTTPPPRAAWQQSTPKPPEPSSIPERSPPSPRPPGAPPVGAGDITLAFDQTPLPLFTDTVFGKLLHQSYELDPKVAARKDLITLRVPTPKRPEEAEAIAIRVLAAYGVEASPPDENGVRHFFPARETDKVLPAVLRGRSLPDTPSQLRPAFLLVDLKWVRNVDVAGWLRSIYGQKVKILEDPRRNAILIGGPPASVQAALDAVAILDQPLMKGRRSLRINPLYWPADRLAARLSELLRAEGIGATTSLTVNEPVALIPVPEVNALVVFGSDPAVLLHVKEWARSLDTPSAQSGEGRSYLTYHARFSDAGQLQKTLETLLSTPSLATSSAQGGKGKPSLRPTSTPRVVVDAPTNTLIIEADAGDRVRILDLLRTLDRPTKAALIEVTVAEVRVGDLHRLGLEWNYANGNWSIGTNLGIKDRGLNIAFDSGTLKAQLNALAERNRARILSTPRLLTRNGTEASIQVGQQVPVVTSKQTNAATANQGVLQTIEYRDTGVILKVRPIIHGAGQVDLDVTQEVSDAQPTSTGVTDSPTFITRKITTHLSLRDGATVVLGGLIQHTRSNSSSGIPLLSDLPGVGALFRVDETKEDQTELLVLITPYVISDGQDAEALTRAMRQRLEWEFSPFPADRRRHSAKEGTEEKN